MNNLRLSDFYNALVNLLGRVRYGDRVAYLRNDQKRSRTLETLRSLLLAAAARSHDLFTIVAEMSEAVSATHASQISGTSAKARS